MNTGAVIIQTNQLSQIGIRQQIIKDGSSVLVRIIADKGNGKYTGSVAGVRVNITSAKSLAVGSTFVASISAKNGIISITPKQNDLFFDKNIEFNIASTNQLMGFLEALGLSPDEIYLNLLQQFKQLEMKIDSNLLNKIHNLAMKFKGKEKIASEILMILNDKGIEASEEEILNLINLIVNNQNEKDNDNSESAKNLINKINDVKNGWFLLPYELVNLESDKTVGSGFIRMLFSKNDILKMVNMDCNFSDKKYLFSLLFDNKKCKSVKFNISPVELESVNGIIAILKKKFISADINTTVEWAESYEIEGSACFGEEFYGIGGAV